jgi:predicted nucleotidyltransferase
MSIHSKSLLKLVDDTGLAEYCRRNGIARLAVFGSIVTDAFRPDSDIDLLVTFHPEAQIGFLAFSRMQRELSELFGRKVDLVPQKGLKAAIRKDVLDSAEVLYAAR